MKKRKSGKTLGRTTNKRTQLVRGLVVDLVLRDRIVTTHARAHVAKRMAEKLVTSVQTGGHHAYRTAAAMLSNQAAVNRLLHTIVPLFQQRRGGYVRMIKSGFRKGDNAPQAVLEWSTLPPKPQSVSDKTEQTADMKAESENSDTKHNSQ